MAAERASDLTSTELAVMSLLAERPLHGYDIDRLIDERGMRRWANVAVSSIYYVLRRLAERGLIEAVDAPGGRTGRRRFRPTATGTAALRDRCLRALADADAPPADVGIAVSLLPMLPDKRVRAAVAVRRHELGARRDELRDGRARSAGAPPHVATLFDYFATRVEAELAWLECTWR